jgi:ABC-type glycerol-3-phosphate transport system permease component
MYCSGKRSFFHAVNRGMSWSTQAIAFAAILSIIVAFPFLQKYYAKGISLGGVKGAPHEF